MPTLTNADPSSPILYSASTSKKREFNQTPGWPAEARYNAAGRSRATAVSIDPSSDGQKLNESADFVELNKSNIRSMRAPRRLCHRSSDRFLIHFLVFDGSPQTFDEDVVAPGALAVHADGDIVPDKHAGKRQAGELVALVGVEDLRLAVFGQGFLQRLDAHPLDQCGASVLAI
jgi:hypothetical protein